MDFEIADVDWVWGDPEGGLYIVCLVSIIIYNCV